jgi:hypothetical protein
LLFTGAVKTYQVGTSEEDEEEVADRGRSLLQKYWGDDFIGPEIPTISGRVTPPPPDDAIESVQVWLIAINS